MRNNSQGREIRCYDYINHPYEQVRDALMHDALAVFQGATKAAAVRARSVAAELRVDIGGIALEADINIQVKKFHEKVSKSAGPVTKLQIEWEAAKLPRLFPFMRADLNIYPLTATETQLDFSGTYKPPLGVLGRAMNAVAGHRIAEVSVHRFVSDVAGYLRQTLSQKVGG